MFTTADAGHRTYGSLDFSESAVSGATLDSGKFANHGTPSTAELSSPPRAPQVEDTSSDLAPWVAPEPIAGQRCLSPKEVERDEALLRKLRYRVTGELGVVRVMSNDVLNLRETPSPEASVVMTLAHEQRAVVPTGAACVGKESAWLEVAVLGRSGWVNGRFVDYVTGPRDVTQQFEALIAGRRFLSTETLFSAVAKAVREQGKGSGPSDPDVTVLGKQVSATSANMLLENCCFGDDSIRGQQIEVMTERGKNGDWTLSSVRSRQLCYRGVSDDLCL